MAIKFEKLNPGMVLYQRGSHSMENTTLRTKAEWRVRIISVNADERTAVVSWNSNSPRAWYERNLRSLYDWSMYDKNEATLDRGLCDAVTKVTRRKPCQKCKTRHASEECPEKTEEA